VPEVPRVAAEENARRLAKIVRRATNLIMFVSI
jgi:hypothetical protein